MISAGKSVMMKDDLLSKIKPEYLYHKLINPDAHVESLIRQLRIVRLLDSKQYSKLKRNLPYVVCGVFNPPFRRTEGFAYTQYFIIDIDNVTEKEIQIESLRERLQSDTRVMLCFLSPGEDGLKLLFKLKERCYDSGVYSVFYKMFVKKFSAQYNLDQVVDARTSDVTRACFVSVDRNSYYNPEAEVVDMETIINTENTSELFFYQKELQTDELFQTTGKDETDKGTADDEAMSKIKAMLNPNLKSKIDKKEAYVPNELNLLMESLLPYLGESGISVTDVINIHYGKKLRMKVGFKEAEINIFYGSKGYSVVQSPRRGVNEELNGVCAQLISQFLYQ